MEYFPPVFCWIYKPDGNRKWNIFLRCSVGSTSRMETKNRIFSSGVLLDLQARWKQKMEYFPPVFCWIYKPDGNRKWNIFVGCSVGCTSRMETDSGIFSSTVFFWIYKPTGISKWKIFLRFSLGSTSQMETENGIFSSGVLLDLQAGWKQKMEYLSQVVCWIYKVKR